MRASVEFWILTRMLRDPLPSPTFPLWSESLLADLYSAKATLYQLSTSINWALGDGASNMLGRAVLPLLSHHKGEGEIGARQKSPCWRWPFLTSCLLTTSPAGDERTEPCCVHYRVRAESSGWQWLLKISCTSNPWRASSVMLMSHFINTFVREAGHSCGNINMICNLNRSSNHQMITEIILLSFHNGLSVRRVPEDISVFNTHFIRLIYKINAVSRICSQETLNNK